MIQFLTNWLMITVLSLSSSVRGKIGSGSSSVKGLLFIVVATVER